MTMTTDMPMRLELALARGGISHRQYDHWNRVGILPWGTPGSGNPRPRNLTGDEGRLLIAMGRLVRAGLAPHRAQEIAMDLVETGRADLAGFIVTLPEGAS